MNQDKLPRRTKIIYGLGDWGAAAATTARSLYWLYFISSVVGIELELAGIALVIGRLWDAINDPLMGIFSDRVSTRWGRRRPFFLYGAVPLGLGFFLMFSKPPIDNHVFLAIYYALSFILFDTAFTLISVPYSALGAELTEDYDERSSVQGWRAAIAITAALLTAGGFKFLAEGVFQHWFEGPDALRQGYSVAAAIWGVLITLSPLVAFFGLEEPVRPKDDEPLRLVQTFKEVFGNRPFRLASLIYLITFAVAEMMISPFIWFLLYYMRVEPPLDSILLGTVLLVAFITMPLVVRMMQTIGKKETYIICMIIFAVALFFIVNVTPGKISYLFGAAIFSGLGYGAAITVPWALVLDVVEIDELATGKRREGIFTGYLVLFRKLAAGGALYFVTIVLARTGFIEGTGSEFVQQPEATLNALRIIIGVIPAIMLLVAIWLAWIYPINRESHKALREELAQKRIERGMVS